MFRLLIEPPKCISLFPSKYDNPLALESIACFISTCPHTEVRSSLDFWLRRWCYRDIATCVGRKMRLR